MLSSINKMDSQRFSVETLNKDQCFPTSYINKERSINWPIKSLDLAPCDFLFMAVPEAENL